jgi:hypothetical protein
MKTPVILIVLGLIFLVGNFTEFDTKKLWPLILVAWGIGQLLDRMKSKTE